MCNRMQTAIAAAALTIMACAVDAQTTIPSGSAMSLNGGSFDGGGTAVQVDGQLQLGDGNLLGISDFSVGGSGQAQLDSGHVVVSGNWSNQGSIDAGSSLVSFVDGSNAASAVLGSTTFAALDFTSGTGKHYLFDSGQTQTVTTALTIHGTAAAPIQMDVTAPGTTAFLDLIAGGSQDIAHVGVSDVHATGQHLAPALHNEGGRGNDTGWFGSITGGGSAVPAIPVPATSTWASALLVLLLASITLLRGMHRRDAIRNHVQ